MKKEGSSAFLGLLAGNVYGNVGLPIYLIELHHNFRIIKDKLVLRRVCGLTVKSLQKKDVGKWRFG